MEDGRVIVKKSVFTEEEEKTEEVINIDPAEEMKVLVSGMLCREGRRFVRVSFMRGKDWAEGIVPDGVIDRSEGFNGEELGRLKDYLESEKEMILEQARGVNPLRNMLDM